MNKLLGQHLLKNESAIKKIIAALNIKNNETIIEIGPGRGALTFPLINVCRETNSKLIAIEKDPHLAKSFGENTQLPISNFQIMEGDALKIIPETTKSSKLKAQSYKLVGNIPYYITGKLLRVISELENKPELSILMLQKEVAERICAKHPKMNLLAAAVQFWAEPKILFTLKPADFDPPPEVNSAVIRLESRIMNDELGIMEKYYKLIHIIFKQPRKTLLNNLKEGLTAPKGEIESALKSLKIDLKTRPQNLSIEQIKILSQILK